MPPSETAWAQVRLKHIASHITSGSRDWSEYFSAGGSPFLRIGNLSRGELALKLDDLQMVSPPAGSEGMRTQVSLDDILLSITAYLGSVGLADAMVVGGFVSQHIALVRIGRDDVLPRWVAYALLAPRGQEQLGAAAYGGTKIQLSLEDVRNLVIPLPPLGLQIAFCERLDRELGRLDEILREKQRLLGLLTEKRKAIIATAVTRGLGQKVKLRDSGVPWLGEIPAHWAAMRVRHLISRLEQGWSPEAENREPALDEWGVLKLNAIDRGTFHPSAAKTLPASMTPRPELEVQPGDVLVTRANTPSLVGDACFVAQTRPKLMLCDLIYRLRFQPERVDARFLVHFLVTAGRLHPEMTARGTSNSMVKLSQEHIKDWSVPLPPTEEQHAIVEHIARETAKLDAVRAATERTIALLKERRAALIAAAVTGQLDVGAAA